MNRGTPAAGALSLLLVLLSCSSQAVMAQSSVGGTTDWTFVGRPTSESIGISPAVASTFDNHLDVSVLAIVLMVLRDNSGQMVYYSTATLNITRGSYGTAYTAAVGLPPGTYNATIFAMTTGGVAISNSSSIMFSP